MSDFSTPPATVTAAADAELLRRAKLLGNATTPTHRLSGLFRVEKHDSPPEAAPVAADAAVPDTAFQSVVR